MKKKEIINFLKSSKKNSINDKQKNIVNNLFDAFKDIFKIYD